MNWQQAIPYIAPILVIGLVARRLIRNAPRKVRPWRVFIPPAIVATAVIATFGLTPMPGPIWLAGFIVAAAAGCGVGFLTTHHQEFSIDRETGEITSRATPIGLMLVGAFFVVRFGLKFVTGAGNPYGPDAYAANLHPSASLIGWTDMGIMFSMGLVIARAATTWSRTRPLVVEHKAAKAQSTPVEAAPTDDQSSNAQ